MPLIQVRSFISENRQLLNVQSAQEIEKDGISIGKRNRINLGNEEN